MIDRRQFLGIVAATLSSRVTGAFEMEAMRGGLWEIEGIIRSIGIVPAAPEAAPPGIGVSALIVNPDDGSATACAGMIENPYDVGEDGALDLILRRPGQPTPFAVWSVNVRGGGMTWDAPPDASPIGTFQLEIGKPVPAGEQQRCEIVEWSAVPIRV